MPVLTMQLYVLEEGVVRGTCSYPSIPQDEDRYTQRLNMELDLQSLCTAVLFGCDPATLPPPPRIWAHLRGRYWSAKIDDVS
jgi:hypothetical protein